MVLKATIKVCGEFCSQTFFSGAEFPSGNTFIQKELIA
jgi:hypothetical protein